MPSATTPSFYSAALRRELSARNRAFAVSRALPTVESYGSVPVIVYEPYCEDSRHGNFIEQSYAAILKEASWRKRLSKVHSQARWSLPERSRRWMELDSSTSSDALLMNIFCYPGILPNIAGMLGISETSTPVFGFKAGVPLKS
jgi:hypothetical protein